MFNKILYKSMVMIIQSTRVSFVYKLYTYIYNYNDYTYVYNLYTDYLHILYTILYT